VQRPARPQFASNTSTVTATGFRRNLCHGSYAAIRPFDTDHMTTSYEVS
jgi:hypothetical protein